MASYRQPVSKTSAPQPVSPKNGTIIISASLLLALFLSTVFTPSLALQHNMTVRVRDYI